MDPQVMLKEAPGRVCSTVIQSKPKSQYAHNDHRTHFHKSVPVHRIVHVLQSDLFIGLYGITNGYPTPQWSITTGNL